MATFKHISSKNADYGAAEQYLTFEHDEFTMKPTLDENGRLIPRDDYRISSLNCGDEDFAIYEESGFSSPEELEAALATASAELNSVHAELKTTESTLREKKDLQKQLLAYIKTKPARDGLKAQKTEKARRAYREQHESDFIIAEAATRYFKAQGISKLPASKALQAEIEQLTREKNALYNEYREKKESVRELQTIKGNIEQILRGAPSRHKKQEQER